MNTPAGRSLEPGAILRRARHLAGLTQRELAERAGTSQSVVARIESGTTSPTTATLDRLLDSAGFELRVRLVQLPIPGNHMLEAANLGRLEVATRIAGPDRRS